MLSHYSSTFVTLPNVQTILVACWRRINHSIDRSRNDRISHLVVYIFPNLGPTFLCLVSPFLGSVFHHCIPDLPQLEPPWGWFGGGAPEGINHPPTGLIDLRSAKRPAIHQHRAQTVIGLRSSIIDR